MSAASLDPRITPARPDLAAQSLQGRVEAARFVEGRVRRVAAPYADLRRAPQADAELGTQALCGEPVTVYEDHEGWAWGQLENDRYVGYLPADALGEASGAPTHRVAALRSFLFPGPDIKLPPVGALPFGARVHARAMSGEFARVDAGFLWARHLAPAETYETDFVSVAERFVGVSYLWGGKTVLGIDCSGLVQLSLAAAGFSPPRDSDQQERSIGVALVGSEALRRGDLVFWAGHVGIMRDGETLLHANGHAMAVTSEPLAEAAARIQALGGGAVTSVRRP